jgi:hypothetical protein
MPDVFTQRLTLLVLIAATALVLAYNVAAYSGSGLEPTVCKTLRDGFGRYPSVLLALVFWLGVWIGHAFVPILMPK